SIGSNFSYILIFIGFILAMKMLVYVGIILFSAVVLFQIVTLPVEIDASNRAKKLLVETGILTSPAEREGVSAVLNAAAWTYVAAAVSSILTLLYFLFRAGLLGGSDD
ncbi:MAG: zinc metallopeptidase, partial [Candidatus Hydrogenedentota bacterium]